MKLIDANKLSRKQYKELIESLGGKYSFLQRIRMGGTGVGGLFLKPEEQPDLNLRYKTATETIKVSFEHLQSGLIIGLNNTKEIKLLSFTQPRIEWAILDQFKIKRSQKVQTKLHLLINDYNLYLYTSGWNNREVFRYLNQLSKTFNSRT